MNTEIVKVYDHTKVRQATPVKESVMFESILQKILSLLVVFGLAVPDAAAATENINSHKVETGQYQQI